MTHQGLRPTHGVDLDLCQAKMTSEAHRRAMLPLIYHLSSPCAAWNCFPATTLNPACSVIMETRNCILVWVIHVLIWIRTTPHDRLRPLIARALSSVLVDYLQPRSLPRPCEAVVTRQSQLRPELGGEPPHQKMPLQAEVTAAEHMDLLQKLKDPQVLKDLTEDAVVWATQHGLVRIVWVGAGGDRSHTVLLWRS